MTSSGSELFSAVADNDLEAVVTALDSGVPVDARGPLGRTACSMATGWRSTEILSLLIERGADFEVPDDCRNTPLMAAVVRGEDNEECLRLLLRAGADPMRPNRAGATPALMATRQPAELERLFPTDPNPLGLPSLGIWYGPSLNICYGTPHAVLLWVGEALMYIHGEVVDRDGSRLRIFYESDLLRKVGGQPLTAAVQDHIRCYLMALGSPVEAVAGSEPVLVRDGDHLEIGAGQTAFVWAGGVVVAHGGRVTVGSGGVCLSDGDTVVSLVDDGTRVILPETPVPVAVMRRGTVTAETGSAYLAAGCTYFATGTAHVSEAPGASGEVSEGRLVEVEGITTDTVDEVWSAAYQTWAGEASSRHARSHRSEMAAVPGPDAVAWLTPLFEGLLRHGATPLATQTRRDGTILRVSTPDLFACLTAVYADIAVPPTVTICDYASAPHPLLGELNTTYGACIEIVDSNPAPPVVDRAFEEMTWPSGSPATNSK